MLAVGLTILGLELSTKIVSLAAGRVSSGFSAIANGLEFHVSTGRFLTGVAMLVHRPVMRGTWGVAHEGRGVCDGGRRSVPGMRGRDPAGEEEAHTQAPLDAHGSPAHQEALRRVLVERPLGALLSVKSEK
jgi:hypothetical protein